MPLRAKLRAALACTLPLQMFAASACVGDDATDETAVVDAGVDGDARGAGGSAEGSSGHSGGGGGPDAGGGEDSSAGSGGQGEGAAGGATEAGADAPNHVPLCARLGDLYPVYALTVAKAYELNVDADCRINWVTRQYLNGLSRSDFINHLLAWNMSLWGCTTPPPTDFALLYEPAPLTSTDAEALIGYYIAAANDSFTLSASEEKQLRAALESLAQPTIKQVSDAYSMPACPVDGGVDGAGKDASPADASGKDASPADGSAADGAKDGSAPDGSVADSTSDAPPEGNSGGELDGSADDGPG